MRQIQVYVSHHHADEIIEACSRDPIDSMIHRLLDFQGSTHTMIRFVCQVKHTGKLLAHLEDLGVGELFGEIDVVPLTTVKPIKLKAPKNEKEYRLHDRLTMEEIYSTIDEGTHLTFDYMLNTFYAAMIAAVGLVSDSDATVVSSMLISPLMGPILGLTFGCKVRDWSIVKRCLKNELIGALITLGVGMMVGAVCAQFWGPYCQHYSLEPDEWCFGVNSTTGFQLNSGEMISRGQPVGLIGGFFVAMPAGGAGALALMGGGNSALVGVAIAVALLPPLTNSGILLAMSVTYYLQPPVVETKEQDAMFKLCFYSFVLFCMNFACIFVSAYFMFYLKRVDALPLRSTKWRRASEHIKAEGKRLSALGSMDSALKDPILNSGNLGFHCPGDDNVQLLVDTDDRDASLGRHTMQEVPVPRQPKSPTNRAVAPLSSSFDDDRPSISSLKGASLRDSQRSLRDSVQLSASVTSGPRSRNGSVASPRSRNNSLTPRERPGSRGGGGVVLRQTGPLIVRGARERSTSATRERTTSAPKPPVAPK